MTTRVHLDLPIRGTIAALTALWLVGSACGEHGGGSLALLPRAAGGDCGTVYLEGIEDGFDLAADLATPGASPEIVLDAFVPGTAGNQILLTRQLVLTLPAEFGFAGFDANGPGTAATWDFDFFGNGVFDPFSQPSDYRIPIVAQDTDLAFADALANLSYDDGIDPTVTHVFGTGGAHVFTVVLPSGGTNNLGDADDPCSYFDTDTRFTLPAGIVTLPAAPGSYDVEVVATSVDPDTGDLDDAQGAAPVVYQRTFPITVPEPGAALAGAGALLALAGLRARAAR